MTLWLDVFTNGNYRLDRVINANALGNFFSIRFTHHVTQVNDYLKKYLHLKDFLNEIRCKLMEVFYSSCSFVGTSSATEIPEHIYSRPHAFRAQDPQ